VVRAGPDVDEDEGPEVDDRKFVAVHRTVGRLGHEVVHQAQVRRGQEEGHRVVTIPPLHQCILHTGIDAVTLEQAYRDREGVDDVQHGHGDPGGDVEPDGHVQVALAALEDGAEHVDTEHDPDQGDRDIDGPLELGVFLAGCDAQWQCDSGRHDDQLPAPEMEPAQAVVEHAGLQQALEAVVHTREDAIAHKGENDGVGVQGAQTTEGEPLGSVHPRQDHLQGSYQPNEHPYNAEDDRRRQEGIDDLVVVLKAFHHRVIFLVDCSGVIVAAGFKEGAVRWLC
jgi:hypothetical protein